MPKPSLIEILKDEFVWFYLLRRADFPYFMGISLKIESTSNPYRDWGVGQV
jgi:hypothetical protein